MRNGVDVKRNLNLPPLNHKYRMFSSEVFLGEACDSLEEGIVYARIWGFESIKSKGIEEFWSCEIVSWYNFAHGVKNSVDLLAIFILHSHDRCVVGSENFSSDWDIYHRDWHSGL